MAEKGVAEVALILLTGFAAYILSEWATFSGVISMLFCGITLSHFNVYNLTP
jgi:NhaP-type Na+/H+ or K+/H+ antiporter